ncbi:tetratricopeptide repeat protein [Actinoplanes sp. NPDC026670]|uniref:tetratricopeptide repeat protein n=1 Tax=Actinoplanes sp. NPDC026670 TaxID=3154700 RepID=UPI0033D47A49
MTGSRWRQWRVARRLELARYWHRHADLDAAARQAGHALRLVAAGTVPVPAQAEAALTAAVIDRDRDEATASHAHLTHAVRLLDAAPPTPRRNTLLMCALTALGDGHRRGGRYPQATATLRRARALVEAETTPDPRQLAAVLTVLGITAKELGAYGPAARCYAQVEALYRGRTVAPADQATLHHNLAGLAYAQRQFPQAETHARRAVRVRGRQRAAKVELAADLSILGAAIAAQDRHDEAREHLRRALAICAGVRPPPRYEIAVHLHNLAAVDHAEGHLDAAEQGYRHALAIKEHLLGADHPEIGMICNNLGTLLHDQGRRDEARGCYLRASAIAEHTYPAGHPTTMAIHHNLRRLTDVAPENPATTRPAGEP